MLGKHALYGEFRMDRLIGLFRSFLVAVAAADWLEFHASPFRKEFSFRARVHTRTPRVCIPIRSKKSGRILNRRFPGGNIMKAPFWAVCCACALQLAVSVVAADELSGSQSLGPAAAPLGRPMAENADS